MSALTRSIIHLLASIKNAMVPLISSRCQGLLGISHLPRLWWKIICDQQGVLDSTYAANSGELDTWVLDVLQLDVEATYAHLRSECPDYVAFEHWVREHGSLVPYRIARWNSGVQNRVFVQPSKLEQRHRDIPLPESDPFVSAVLLNNLQDWSLFHRISLSDIAEGMPPLVSSIDTGRMGVCQLPRTWLKVTLQTKGLLHPDFPACGGGLDQNVIDALGLNRDETLDYLTSSLPTYIEFEQWVTEQIGTADREAIDDFHSFMYNRRHPEPKRSGILDLIGLADDGTLHNGVLMNHLEDWKYAHTWLTATFRKST